MAAYDKPNTMAGKVCNYQDGDDISTPGVHIAALYSPKAAIVDIKNLSI